MGFRKLKIAWTLGSGIVFVLLVMLWVRSYGTWDRCFCTGMNHGWQFNSMLGHVVLVVAVPPKEPIPFFYESLPTQGRFQGDFDKYVLGFYIQRKPSLETGVPFWFIVTIGLGFAVAPWLRQFSLRALVIVMSVLAIVLAMALHAEKQALQ